MHHKINKKIIKAIPFIFSFTLCKAEVHHVVVQDNNFTPSNISIKAGDSVRWENFGNNNHNVASTDLDYSFRCATGCEDIGGDGTPAGIGWVSVVTFHKPDSSIPYICEPHVGFGMTGSINVQTPVEYETISVSELNGFEPMQLSIPQYATVLIVNGGGEHNFHADDDSFRCADGCRDDGVEGFNGYTGFPWQFYMQFNEPGIFGYHCENPGHNESGLIEVIDEIIYANGFQSQ